MSVVEMATQDLKNTEVADHDVDHDWVARFFTDVQDITSEEMQRIWARILAGEVETPGRTSLHTLNILKNMSQRDAELFAAASTFVFRECIIHRELYFESIPSYPSENDLLRLDSYGLIKFSQLLQDSWKTDSLFFVCRMNKNLDKYYRFSGNKEQSEITIPVYPLTPQGNELYRVIEISDNKYAEQAVARYVKNKYGLTLESFEAHRNGDKITIPNVGTFLRQQQQLRSNDPRLPWAPVPLGGSSDEDAGS